MPPERHRQIEEAQIAKAPKENPGNSVHMSRDSGGRNRDNVNAGEISLFARSILNPGRDTVMGAYNRTIESIDVARAG